MALHTSGSTERREGVGAVTRTPPAPGEDKSEFRWSTAVAAVGGAAGLTGVVYAVGGVTAWLRLRGAGSGSHQALGAIPDQTLLATGASRLFLPAVAGFALAVAAFVLIPPLERRARRRADIPHETGSPRRHAGWLRRASRRCRELGRYVYRCPVTRLLTAPLRWYLRRVPPVAWAWLPVLLFTPAPVTTFISFIQIMGGLAIGQWATETDDRRRGLFRLVGGTVVLIAAAGLLHEWYRPHALPEARVLPKSGPAYTVGFVAIDGGQAYVVRHRRLVVSPMAEFKSLTVSEAPERPPDRSASVAERVLGGIR